MPKIAEFTGEDIAREISQVRAGIDAIRSGRLTQETVIILIQEAIGHRNISRKQIKAVLDNAGKLDTLYLKREHVPGMKEDAGGWSVR